MDHERRWRRWANSRFEPIAGVPGGTPRGIDAYQRFWQRRLDSLERFLAESGRRR
jgi:hypothetical protein